MQLLFVSLKNHRSLSPPWKLLNKHLELMGEILGYGGQILSKIKALLRRVRESLSILRIVVVNALVLKKSELYEPAA